MKKFVPYYDGILADLLPDDRLVPYRTAWSQYLSPGNGVKAIPGEQASGKSRVSANGASVRPPTQAPTR